METSPDSSLAILQNIESPEKLANKDYAFYCLLLTQALDKNYSIHTSDSLIKKATAYFEQHSDDAALALSYFYMGRVYSDMHDALQAQQYYLKALELGENLNSPQLLIRIYNSLGTLYSFQSVYEMALPMYKNTLHLLENSDDSTSQSFALRNIARVFSQTQQLDSAICYYQQAIKIATPHTQSSLYNDLGILYIKTEKLEEAHECLQNAVRLCNNPKLLPPIYLTLGEYFIKTGQYDSATCYLNKSIKSPLLYTQAGSLYLFAEIEYQKQNYSKSIEFLRRYELLNDSITKNSHFENIRMTQSMFNYQRLTDEKNNYEKKAANRMIVIYQILIGTVILFIVCFILYKKDEQKKKKLLDLKEQLYKQSQQYIEDNKLEIAMLEEKLFSGQEVISEVKKQLLETQKLMLEMENRQITIKQNTLKMLQQDFRKSSLYIKINKAENVLTESEWSELALLIDATFSNFTQRILELYQRISTEELRVCYLVKIGIPVKKIATLMSVTSSGVSQCRRRLYKKLTNEPENAEKFDSFIADF